MSRIVAIELPQAVGKAKQRIGVIRSELGPASNMIRVMANFPAVLEGNLNFGGVLQV